MAVLGSMPSVGLYFGVYSYSKRTIGPFLLCQNHYISRRQRRTASDKEEEEKEDRGGGRIQISSNLMFRESTIQTITIALSAAIGEY